MRIARTVFSIAALPVAALSLPVLVYFVALLIPVGDPPSPPAAHPRIVITGGSVIDVVDGTVRRRSVLVVDGRIEAVAAPGSVAAGPNDEVVDASGSFLIPGLWDMHAHVGSGLAPQLTLPLFVAAGVLNVRDMGGFAGSGEKAAWDDAVRRHDLVGPRFRAKAALSVGSLGSLEDARAVVAQFPGRAPDFIKTYNAILPEYYFPMLAEANARNIPVLGHKPRAVDAVAASKAGHRSFEHARLFLYECYPGATNLREEYRARYSGEIEGEGRAVTPAVMREMLDTHDVAMFDRLVSAMVENDVWFCPTHITRKMDAFADDPAYRNDDRLRYVDRWTRFRWKRDADGLVADDPSPEDRATYRDFYRRGLELTGKAHAAGVRVLAGTDACDTHCFPGSGMHDELEDLVAAGLSPLEAIRSATITPAAYFGADGEEGRIAPGHVADILILDENPLRDIRNTRTIRTVVQGEVVYGRAALDSLLDGVARSAGSWHVAAHVFRDQGL